MTRSSPARKARREQRRKIAAGAHRKAHQLTPEQAREQLAKWAAAGGDLPHLLKTNQVRYKGDVLPDHKALQAITRGVDTIASLKARYAEPGGDVPTVETAKQVERCK